MTLVVRGVVDQRQGVAMEAGEAGNGSLVVGDVGHVAMGEADCRARSAQLGRKGFAKDFPQVDGWLKKFTMSDAQLFPLEDLVMNRDKGREAQGVAEWEKQNPGVVRNLTR